MSAIDPAHNPLPDEPPLDETPSGEPEWNFAAAPPPPVPAKKRPAPRRLPPAATPPAPPGPLPTAPPPLATAESAPPASSVADPATAEEGEPAPPLLAGGALRTSLSCAISLVTHVALFLALALIVPQSVEDGNRLAEVRIDFVPQEPEPESIVELDQRTDAAEQPSTADSRAAAFLGSIGALGEPAHVELPTFDRSVEENVEGPAVKVGPIPLVEMTSQQMFGEVPDGQLGDPRAVVDSYDEAFDRITQELLWMLHKRKVLLVWCMDQSESMKDDQREIRDRIERVYKELGLTSTAAGDRLTTGVTSYGEGFILHTPKATSKLSEIRAAIDSVPVDPSGKEMMCQAVGKSINAFRQVARGQDRQLVLILVTDESGEPVDNNLTLELAVAEAKAAKAKIYTLGREAVFGYPYAFMRWIHPQTGGHHWLQIDRGPESALVEQLQTDGFRRRHDAFPSGFAPYEQARLTKETGGVFFMLPSLEANLVRGEKRRYELELMRAYKPDLGPRAEYARRRELSKLESTMARVINDLNPYVPEISRYIEMRVHFSTDPAEFVRQVRQEQAKAIIYLDYLARATKTMESLQPERQKETSPRVQANYDLLFAQLYAYQARIYEYGAYLEEFVKNPQRVPYEKPPNLRFVHWTIVVRKPTIAGKVSQPFIDRGAELFRQIVIDHPGTPWAARAEHELSRGFGVHLVPEYHAPLRPVSGAPIPIPKL